MKKILFIASFALLLVFSLSTNVYAASAEWDAFKTEMTGSTGTATLTAELVGEAEAITVTGDITLDLGGKTLILNEQIIVEGSLTITNGTINTDTVSRPIDVMAGGALTISNATLKNTVEAGSIVRVYGTETAGTTTTKVSVAKDATLDAWRPIMVVGTGSGAFGVEVDVAGTLKSVYYGLYVNGSVKGTEENVPEIKVATTAKVTSTTGPAVYAAGYANWTIDGGYFEGTEALSIKAGSFDINGGTFKATGTFVNPIAPEYSATEDSGAAISITSNKTYAGNVKMSIENATVESTNGYAILEVITDADSTAVSSMEVISGTFTSGEDAGAAIYAQNVTEFVKGGTFDTDVADYVDTTLDSIKDEATGEYYVGILSAVEVIEAKNGKVTTSVTEAIDGQTVTVTATAKDGYKLNKVTVKDASGNAVKVTNNSFIMPASEVTVEATFTALPLDNTPATGYIDTVMIGSAVVALMAVIAIVLKRKVGNN